MKKYLAVILSLTILIGLFTGCGQADKSGDQADPTAPTTIKLAVLAPITGPAAADGVSISHGVQMAIDEINANGGILGAQVELDIQDVGSTADTAVNVANLVAADSSYTAIIGPHYSSQILAIGDTLAEAKIPVITGGTTTSVMETVSNPYMIRTRTADSIVAAAGAAYLAEELNVKKVGILYSTDDFGSGAMKEATAYFESSGIDYVCEAFEVTDSDVTSQLLSLSEAKVDSLFIWSMGNGFIAACRQLYELGMNDLPTICCPALSMENMTSLMDPQWTEGYYCTAHWLMNQTDELSTVFVENYTSKYEDVPSMVTVAWYESAKWICHCIEQAGSTDADAIMEQVRATSSYQTAYCTYNYKDRDVCTECMIAQQADGILVPLMGIDGAAG